MELLGMSDAADILADELAVQVAGEFFTKCFALLVLVCSYLRRKRRWRKLFRNPRAWAGWRGRRKGLRGAVKPLRKLARVHKVKKQRSFALGMNALRTASKARDEAAFQTALTTAESCFGGAFAETRDGQTTTALVAAAVSAFYRDDRPRAVYFLKAALGANIFVGDEKRWKNYFRYMVFMTLKREIWSFLASIQACDSLGGYLKKAEQALGERAGSYRKTAKQYSGAQARAWRDAAKRAKQLRRATKKLRRWQRWTWLAPTTVDHVFGRIDKKMRRVYKRIQEPNLATVAADVYRNVYFLPIDGAGRPTCWGFFWRFCLCLAIVFATIFAIAAVVDAI